MRKNVSKTGSTTKFMVTTMITCCKDCVAPKRHVGCHAECQEYIDEKKKHDEKKAEIDRQRQSENAIDDHRISNIIKNVKKRRHKW